MRTLWATVSVLAVAHLLALVGFIGWLGATGRLDRSRLERLGALFGETVDAERARLEAEAAAAADAERPQQPEGFAIPVSASAVVEEQLAMEEAGRTELRRMMQDAEALRAALVVERAQVDAQRTEVEAQRAAFEAMRQGIDALEGDEQFRKSLGVLQGMKAEDAATVLRELIAGRGELVPAAPKADGQADLAAPEAGVAPDGMTRAVSYLDRMSSRSRTKIMTEITEQDAALATELLERLRTHGLVARAAEDSGG